MHSRIHRLSDTKLFISPLELSSLKFLSRLDTRIVYMFEGEYYRVYFYYILRSDFVLIPCFRSLNRLKWNSVKIDTITRLARGSLIQSTNLIENTLRSNYTRACRHNIRISDNGAAEWGIWEEHMQIKSARIVRYGKALGKICMEIRIKICAPILCTAFGSDPNPRWPSAEDRLLRNYTAISVSRTKL